MSRHDMDALGEQLAQEATFYMTLTRHQEIMTIAQREGYIGVCWIRDRGVCGILRQAYSVGVFYGLCESGYDGRFCFNTELNALLFLKDWDGVTLPVIGVDGCKAIK